MATGPIQIQFLASTEQTGDGTVLQAVPKTVGESYTADACVGQGAEMVVVVDGGESVCV